MTTSAVRKTLVVLVLALSAHALPALAGGYIGIGVGEATIDVCNDLEAYGATRCDDNDTGYKLFGGYEFHQYLAVEGTYADYGEVKASAPGFVVGAEATSLAVSVKGEYQVTDSLGLFAKLGVARWDAEVSVAGLGDTDDDGSGSTWGIGAQYPLTDKVGVRAEWERTAFDSDDVDLWSVSIVYRFQARMMMQ